MSVTAFAPGKLILMGEHAVVYGHTALAMAVDRGLEVTLTERAGPTDLDDTQIEDERIGQALRSLLPDEGVGVTIRSSIPIGRGMGSSAALAVALARATLAREGRTIHREALNERAFAVERIFHGSPSGIDHTVSMSGGAMLYRRTPSGPVFEAFDLPALPIVVIDSGTAGNTATMVRSVAERLADVRGHLEAMGALLRDTLPALRDGDLHAIGEAWNDNQRLLQAIGVSTPVLDAIARVACEAGATGAKLAGAGGGGVVIALSPDPSAVKRAAGAQGWSAFEVACIVPDQPADADR